MSGGASGLITQLEKDLRALWEAPDDPTAARKSRVCTMNLEVVSGSRELIERYTPVIDEVTASIPSRVILASVEPGAQGDALTGRADAVCTSEGICSERVFLSATGNAAVRSASAIEAFLVPEIPTALVWLGRVHTSDPVFEELANDVERIILDSMFTSLPSLLGVAQWARAKASGPRVSDMAWTRLAQWQELIARFFDPLESRALAHQITKVTLKQASEPGDRLGSEGALILGWMGTRLGWKVARLGGSVRFQRPDGGTVTLELGNVKRPEGVAPHSLASVAIEAGELTCRVDRELASGGQYGREGQTLDADVVLWSCSSPGHPPQEQHVRLSANKAARWLERTLHRPASDLAFDESVAFAEHIVDDGLTV